MMAEDSVAIVDELSEQDLLVAGTTDTVTQAARRHNALVTPYDAKRDATSTWSYGQSHRQTMESIAAQSAAAQPSTVSPASQPLASQPFASFPASAAEPPTSSSCAAQPSPFPQAS
ncbi:hypothetical protein HXX76_004491 [Chlamydomonas incerta]|uniref:Uncharacterized protein n=1 Tax=Chlamydomonas incerta TaxID=51695 RepID=A0A835W6H0_CHLIN|nr:hypothetical protein HXX76_004491 [Chlamydomonas incerta]|eukprot:KAG2439123.1 hypothetical protein HXX76_004491 [Chlamydomonas incerta]